MLQFMGSQRVGHDWATELLFGRGGWNICWTEWAKKWHFPKADNVELMKVIGAHSKTQSNVKYFIPTNSIWKFSLISHPHQHMVFSVCFMVTILMGMQWDPMVNWMYVSQMNHDMKHPFICHSEHSWCFNFTFNTFIYLYTIKMMSHYNSGSRCMSIIININIDCIYLYATKNTQIILQETRAWVCVQRYWSSLWLIDINQIYFLVNLSSKTLAYSVVYLGKLLELSILSTKVEFSDKIFQKIYCSKTGKTGSRRK